MADLFLHISVSLDGYIEDEHGDIEWMTSDTSFDDYSTRLLQSIDAMVFGRTAHALLARFWPTAAERTDATPALVAQAALMNSLPKFVLTHGAAPAAWAHSYALQPAGVRTLKTNSARPIALFAGARAAQSLLAENLVDDVRLIYHPIVLGGGTPLFASGARTTLRLLETQAFPSGAVLHHYSVAREVPSRATRDS
jgi:dihydrofolate reductase